MDINHEGHAIMRQRLVRDFTSIDRKNVMSSKQVIR